MFSTKNFEQFRGLLRLFPLPDVVFFPNSLLPLHIFEPRYREMARDALSGDRLIGMALLKPGWQDTYEGSPPIFKTVCMGEIIHAEKLPDGRYNLVLHGHCRAKIVRELPTDKPYRTAEIELQSEHRKALSPRRVGQLRNLLFDAFSRVIEPPHWGFTVFSAPHLELGIAADLIAASFPSDPLEKQKILESLDVEERVERLIRILDREEGKGRRIRMKRLPFVHELARS